jgi:predicted transcriptional regulator
MSRADEQERQSMHRQAKDIMNPAVLVARTDMTVSELTTFLLENEISGAPVEDRDGTVVGVVSLTDVARASADGGELVRTRPRADFYGFGDEAPELQGLHVVEDDDALVAQIMTPAVYSVDTTTPLPVVARTMLESHVHRLLVTRNGRIAGIVTTTDLLRVVAEQDRPTTV